MNLRRLPACVCLIGCLSGAGCGLGGDCDRQGCDAIDEPVGSAGIEQGIAGAAASESDVVANGCQECSLTVGSLRVWASAMPVTTKEEAVAIIGGGAPDQTLDIDSRYEADLGAGDYLVCSGTQGGGACAGITIEAGAVVTVHIRYAFGPAELVVFEPGQTQPRSTGMFQVDDTDVP